MSHSNIFGGGATSYQEQHRPHSYYLKLYLTKSKKQPYRQQKQRTATTKGIY